VRQGKTTQLPCSRPVDFPGRPHGSRAQLHRRFWAYAYAIKDWNLRGSSRTICKRKGRFPRLSSVGALHHTTKYSPGLLKNEYSSPSDSSRVGEVEFNMSRGLLGGQSHGRLVSLRFPIGHPGGVRPWKAGLAILISFAVRYGYLCAPFEI
jgi:hypothetical protein